jgi:hypothetical protein
VSGLIYKGIRVLGTSSLTGPGLKPPDQLWTWGMIFALENLEDATFVHLEFLLHQWDSCRLLESFDYVVVASFVHAIR